MDAAHRDYFPSGDLRVSDAERDQALSELSEALQAGRITTDEFDERSGQVLRARTGKELVAPLADLPVSRAQEGRGAAVDRAPHAPVPVSRFTIAASAAAAIFTIIAIGNAVLTSPTLQQREIARHMMARQGVSIPLPPDPGFNWIGTITPAAIAVLLVVAIIVRHRARAGHP